MRIARATLTTCPCCYGRGFIQPGLPDGLTVMEGKVYDVVRRAPYGITSADIADRVYADRRDGGPLFARNAIHVFVHKANKVLREHGEQMKGNGGPGSLYRLERIK